MNEAIPSERDVVREFFKDQRKQRRESRIPTYIVTSWRKQPANFYEAFVNWLHEVPDEHVFDYWSKSDCPIGSFAQTLYPGQTVIGDTDRFCLVVGPNEFVFVPIPRKLGEIIHGCAREQGDTMVIRARDLKEAVGAEV